MLKELVASIVRLPIVALMSIVTAKEVGITTDCPAFGTPLLQFATLLYRLFSPRPVQVSGVGATVLGQHRSSRNSNAVVRWRFDRFPATPRRVGRRERKCRSLVSKSNIGGVLDQRRNPAGGPRAHVARAVAPVAEEASHPRGKREIYLTIQCRTFKICSPDQL